MLIMGLGHKLLDALAHARHGDWNRQTAAFFKDRNQLIELGAGVRPGECDAYGMKQLFALWLRFRP